MLTSFKRTVYFGWKNFFNQLSLSFVSSFILILVILLLTSIFILKGVAEHLISLIQEKADISVFFKEDSSEEEILKLRETLAKNLEVKGLEYVSRKSALEKFIERHKDEPGLMKTLSIFENPFLAHLNIALFEAEQYSALVNFLENSDFSKIIEEINYADRRSIINQIFSLTENVKRVGMGASLILGLVAILVAFSTTKLAIFNSREEIKIQRLVGASNWFIRGPYLIQGFLAGFFAFLFSLLFTASLLYFLSPKVEAFLAGFNLLNYFLTNFSTILLIQFATGIGLGVISSYIATRKYLKV
jgi:cell division transport system permease protein